MLSRRRSARALTVITIVFLFGAGCSPEQFTQVFGRSATGQAELDQAARLWQASVAQSQAARDRQLHPWLTCIRHRESDRGAYPHDDGYGARNGRSSASGAYQMVKRTYDLLVAGAGLANRGELANHPWYEQDEIALWAHDNGYASHWPGSC